MLFVKANKISFRYQNQSTDVLKQISFHIGSRSRIGLIGKNGSGKSTLFNIISGSIKVCSGHIEYNNNLKVSSLSQQLSTYDNWRALDYLWYSNPRLFQIKSKIEKLDASSTPAELSCINDFEVFGGYKFEAKISKFCKQLHFREWLLTHKLTQLSGGEKAKLEIIKALLQDPDLLLLDEPTNHLDMNSMHWLKEFLFNLKIPYIIVSHDRHILNECTNETWHLSNGELTISSGAYDFFKEEQQLRERQRQQEYEKKSAKIKQLSAAANLSRTQAQKMERFKPKRSVKKNGGLCKKDEGSGSARANPTKKMRSALAVEKKVDDLKLQLDSTRSFIEKTYDFTLPISIPCQSKTVIALEKLSFSYKRSSLIEDLSLQIYNGEKLAIIGPNGCGKSTLLKLICNHLAPQKGSLSVSPTCLKSYFFQDGSQLNQSATILDEAWNSFQQLQHMARIVLGGLGFKNEMVYQTISNLSPGEQAKVSLAKTILSGANTLILDEPTNHLEIQARETLEKALINYEGTLVFVSHDRAFIDKVSTRVFDFTRMDFL